MADNDEQQVSASLRPFLGRWFEDKSRGDVSALGTFLTACNWNWATRQILCSAPNMMWEIKPVNEGGSQKMTLGVESNALMKKLIQMVGAAPFVTYDCSGAQFSFELFTGVTAHGAKVNFVGGNLFLRKVITAPSYMIECEWVYRIVEEAVAEEGVPPTLTGTCREDYVPSFDGAIPMKKDEVCTVVGDLGVDWTKVRVQRDGEDVIEGFVPTSFIVVVQAAEPAAESEPEVEPESEPEAEPEAEAQPDSESAPEPVSAAGRVEMWCKQTNRVFKRAVEGGDDAVAERGDEVPDMHHTMEQVWVRCAEGQHHLLGKLL
jgi:hypothetical protein